ncbi:glycosyltransferase family 8 protein [uncultured Limosilactobacillus sp.]|uniref:glycosyltransferase family 8 protein n=1 Tax=uncultured Limosilactobacillus sp. TaxID=2837629 RepID=UPI0025CD0AD2|nr:glycosyltransferase family 8 protein [uncultured Limosilactobacillus sp.]
MSKHDYSDIPLTIAMVADWQYAVPVETTLKSIAFHNRNATIYIVNPDFPREWFQRINANLAPLNLQVIDTKISLDLLKNQHVSQIHIDVMSSARLLLPNLLSCSRVLYLDSDILVHQSLAPLFNVNLNGHLIGAVPDIFDHSIFNSGVMVMDLAGLRKYPSLVKQMLDFGTNPDLPDGDQTVLNHFFGQDYQPLADQFNLQVGLESNWDYEWHYAHDPNIKSNYQRMEKALGNFADAVIIHYVCPDKPWSLVSTPRYRQNWWQYYQLSWHQIATQQLPAIQSELAPALIYTQTDTIYHWDQLARDLPQLDINICAPTPVSKQAELMTRYPNVHVFPRIISYRLYQFVKTCSFYLDLNLGPKNIPLMRQLLDRGCPIYATESTVTREIQDAANYHVFADHEIDHLIQTIQQHLASSKE